MAQLLHFEEHALARLRERLGAVEEANQDLIAFARGHSGAVSCIHEAVLAAMAPDHCDSLLHVVTQDWPQILGLDAVAVALVIGDQAFLAGADGVQQVEPEIVDRALHGIEGVAMQNVARGHLFFGPARSLIRAQALVRFSCAAPLAGSAVELPYGLLLLGQRTEQDVDGRHGSELLMFLARSLGAIIRRWLTDPKI